MRRLGGINGGLGLSTWEWLVAVVSFVLCVIGVTSVDAAVDAALERSQVSGYQRILLWRDGVNLF